MIIDFIWASLSGSLMFLFCQDTGEELLLSQKYTIFILCLIFFRINRVLNKGD